APLEPRRPGRSRPLAFREPMRPCLAIAVLATLAALARVEDAPQATTIPAIARIGSGVAAGPVRVQGVITYFDPTRRCLCLPDGDAGVVVQLPLVPPPLRLGQRVEVGGRVLATNYLDATDARVVGEDTLPEPVAVTGEQFAAGAATTRRVTVTGVVRAAGLDADRAVLFLMAGRTSIRVFI